jgi:hypothetical protein
MVSGRERPRAARTDSSQERRFGQPRLGALLPNQRPIRFSTRLDGFTEPAVPACDCRPPLATCGSPLAAHRSSLTRSQYGRTFPFRSTNEAAMFGLQPVNGRESSLRPNPAPRWELGAAHVRLGPNPDATATQMIPDLPSAWPRLRFAMFSAALLRRYEYAAAARIVRDLSPSSC